MSAPLDRSRISGDVDPSDLRERVDRLERVVLRILAAAAIGLMLLGGIRPVLTDHGLHTTFRLLTYGGQALSLPMQSREDHILGTIFIGCFLLLDLWVILMIVLVVLMSRQALRGTGFGRFVFVLGLIGAGLVCVFFLLGSLGNQNTVHLGSVVAFALGVMTASAMFFARPVRELWER